MADTNENTLTAVKNIVVNEFFDKPNGRNVVGVGIGTKVIGEIDTGVPCVRVYVASKAEDTNELAPAELVREEIAGVKTDVIDVGRTFGVRTNVRRLRPVQHGGKGLPRPGSSVGPLVANTPNVNQLVSGTLGAVLRSGPKWYVLSANHVLWVNGRIQLDALIFSPSPEDDPHPPDHHAEPVGKAPIGIALKRTGNGKANRVDCALAETSPDRVNPEFPGGLNVTGFAAPKVGQQVVKYGKATGETYGTIVDVSADIRVDYSFGTFRFTNQILIKSDGEEPFAADGDSGAVIVDLASEQAVGLLFAPVGVLTAACPMPEVIDSLNIELKADLSFAFGPTSEAVSY